MYIRVVYRLSGGTAAVLTHPKEQVVYASNAYLDLRDKLMDDNVLSGITRITLTPRDGSVVKGRQVVYRPNPLTKNRREFVPRKRIRGKVDPRQLSVRKCFAFCK